MHVIVRYMCLPAVLSSFQHYFKPAHSEGIEKYISFHCARHTFATVGITIGIPMEVISKLLGHSDLKTTQIYAKIVDDVKIKEMNKWNSL